MREAVWGCLCGAASCSNVLTVDLSPRADSSWEQHLLRLRPGARVVRFRSIRDFVARMEPFASTLPSALALPRVDLLKVSPGGGVRGAGRSTYVPGHVYCSSLLGLVSSGPCPPPSFASSGLVTGLLEGRHTEGVAASPVPGGCLGGAHGGR